MIQFRLILLSRVELYRQKGKKVESFKRLWESSQRLPGQALITLLFFMIIGVTVSAASVGLIMINSESGSRQQQGEIAYSVAQSGIENALIRVLRTPPPAYTGETLQVGSGQATITVTGSGTAIDPFVILSKGQVGNFLRQIQVKATYQNNVLQVVSQQEVFQ